MEKDRKFLLLISSTAVVIFAFSYAVGYFVGKQAGIKEERAKCEIEKKQIVKTLARITPVSRPQPEIEEKVVGGAPSFEEKEKVEESSLATTQKSQQEKNSTSQESSQKEKTASVELPEKRAKKVETVKATEPKAEEKTPSEKREPIKLSKESEVKEKSGKVYYLQVGVFKSKANAVKLTQKLKEKGFDAKTELSKGYAKVVIGYFKSLQEAMAVRKELKDAGFDSIVRWRKN
jgi:cell division protein FtsN